MSEPKNKHFRRGERLEAEARHELEVIDRVLVGSHTVSSDDAEIAEFALRMRGERPLLDDSAIARLDSRFAQCFAAERAEVEGASRRGRVRRAWSSLAARPAPLAGALATLFVVTAMTLSISGDTIEHEVKVPESDDTSTIEPSAPEGGMVAPSERALNEGLADESGDLATLALPSTEQEVRADAIAKVDRQAQSNSSVRRVERNADLTLATPAKNVEDVADDVIATTDRFGGYVTTSSVSGGDAGNASAQFGLRLPADRFQQALAAYSELAHVRGRTQNTNDITDSYERASDRLKSARAESARLRAKLASTTDETAAKAVRAQLRIAEARESARRREMQAMRNRVSNVTLGLTIVADETAEAADRGTIGKALDSAGEILTTIAAIAIVSLAILAPLALLALGLRWGVRRQRRARAEGAIAAAGPVDGE